MVLIGLMCQCLVHSCIRPFIDRSVRPLFHSVIDSLMIRCGVAVVSLIRRLVNPANLSSRDSLTGSLSNTWIDSSNGALIDVASGR